MQIFRLEKLTITNHNLPKISNLAPQTKPNNGANHNAVSQVQPALIPCNSASLAATSNHELKYIAVYHDFFG